MFLHHGAHTTQFLICSADFFSEEGGRANAERVLAELGSIGRREGVPCPTVCRTDWFTVLGFLFVAHVEPSMIIKGGTGVFSHDALGRPACLHALYQTREKTDSNLVEARASSYSPSTRQEARSAT